MDVSDSTDPTMTGDNDPTVIDLTLRPAIALIKTARFNDKNGYAKIGETLTYNFAVTNTGNVILVNVVIKDPIPGLTISGGPIILRQGETNIAAFTGTYVLTVDDIDAGLVENQAMVEFVTADGLTATDLSDDNSNAEDDPTILPLNACKSPFTMPFLQMETVKMKSSKLMVSNVMPTRMFRFMIVGEFWFMMLITTIIMRLHLEEFLKAELPSIKQKGLPDGTYFYVITYTTYLNEPVSKTGYLYLSGNK